MAGITIPRKACHACREEGYKLFESAAATKRSFLQDMSSDDYKVFS